MFDHLGLKCLYVKHTNKALMGPHKFVYWAIFPFSYNLHSFKHLVCRHVQNIDWSLALLLSVHQMFLIYLISMFFKDTNLTNILIKLVFSQVISVLTSVFKQQILFWLARLYITYFMSVHKNHLTQKKTCSDRQNYWTISKKNS